MNFMKLVLAVSVLCIGSQLVNEAHAVSLVVMATNTTALAGAKVYTIGVKVTAADVAAALLYDVMGLQNVTFTGTSGVSPIHQSGAANKGDVQSVQAAFIDASANNQAGQPIPTFASNGSVTAINNANNAFYRDSWWYTSGNGRLEGVVDSDANFGTITTNPAADGSGVYTLGASNSGTTAIGTTGYLFQPGGAPGMVPANASLGQTMTYSGLFGPGLASHWSPLPGDSTHILGNLLVANHGTLTVPLAQIVTSGNISIPSNFNGGAGTFLNLGTPTYNVLGGPADFDPGAILDYTTDTIHATPEPSTLALAALGALALLASRWRRAEG